MTGHRTSDQLAVAFAAASGRERDRIGRELLDRYDKVIEAIVRDDAAKLGVHVGRGVERFEIRNELRICVFEAAVSFDPKRVVVGDGNGFEHWVRYCMHNRLAALAGEEHAVEMPESWQRVARIASKVDEQLTLKLHRAPRFEELREGVLEHCRVWARTRIVEAAGVAISEVDEDAVTEKLRKQGTLGAIERLADILTLRGKMESISYELDVADDGGERSAVDGVFAMLNAEERFIVEHRMGMFDGREWTFEEIADELDKPWPEVRKVLNTALTKPKAPHAQYVYLAGVGTQLDAGSTSAISRMRARTGAR